MTLVSDVAEMALDCPVQISSFCSFILLAVQNIQYSQLYKHMNESAKEHLQYILRQRMSYLSD